MMKKLIILDHSTQKVHVYNYDENIWESPEHFEIEEGVPVLNSNCEWMLVNELHIQIH